MSSKSLLYSITNVSPIKTECFVAVCVSTLSKRRVLLQVLVEVNSDKATIGPRRNISLNAEFYYTKSYTLLVSTQVIFSNFSNKTIEYTYLSLIIYTLFKADRYFVFIYIRLPCNFSCSSKRKSLKYSEDSRLDTNISKSSTEFNLKYFIHVLTKIL